MASASLGAQATDEVELLEEDYEAKKMTFIKRKLKKDETGPRACWYDAIVLI